MGGWSDDLLGQARAAVEGEFRRNKKLHGRKIRCRQGCVDCCHQIFSIHEMEAAAISRLVKDLPEERRVELRGRAQAYLPERERILSQAGYLEARGNLAAPETRLACPALIDGRCSIYAERPLICRKYGMPLVDPSRAGRIFACELNFAVGEAFEDTRLVQIQTEIAEDFSAAQREYARAGGRRHELPLTVADALLGDFEEFLPL